MPLKTSSEEELPAINLTPMIDVVFLLLIFFMVGTQFNQQERQVNIKLPGMSTLGSMMPAPQRRDVQVGANGAVYLDGQPISALELTQRLSEMKRRYPDLKVAIRADAKSQFGDVAPIMGAVNRAGVTELAIIGLQNEKLR
jgi:biopolymer transport protein ExbD